MAAAALRKAAAGDHGWGVVTACFAEFWATVTHPSMLGGPTTVEEATAFLGSLVDADAATLVPGEDFAARLQLAAEQLGVAGLRIYDLQIALAARDAGAVTIWTHDRDFVRLPGLRVEDPLG